FPSPNLGYVEIGQSLYSDFGKNIYTFVRQVEKPDISTARKFMGSINYLWHSGYRVWNTDTLLALYKKHVPETYDALMNIAARLDLPNEEQAIAVEYSKMIKKSIDYTIFEHLSQEGQAVI